MDKAVELYTDGSAKPNPGAGGIAYIIRYDTTHLPEEDKDKNIPLEYEISKGYKLTTNNRMEILAVLEGLKTITSNINAKTFVNVLKIVALTDSKYFCDAVNMNWIKKWQENGWVTSLFGTVKNKDLWEEWLQISSYLDTLGVFIEVSHIPGHQGFKYNEKCDKLASQAANGKDHIIDQGYEDIIKKR